MRYSVIYVPYNSNDIEILKMNLMKDEAEDEAYKYELEAHRREQADLGDYIAVRQPE